jgi:threonine aldolase
MVSMTPVSRRGFVEALGVGAGLTALTPVPPAHAAADTPNRVVHLSGDGAAITPREYSALLESLCQKAEPVQDTYLLGGDVEQFEQQWAQLLGKEAAVFMPSGTLANQLALRALAGDRRRVIVPEMSHIYNDTGDACQTLSALTLIPLAAGAATFTRSDVEAVLARTSSGRVSTGVGAIAIESPIRRLSGQMFDWDEIRRISTLARERGIGMHLDGARLFIASAYTGIAPSEYAAAFDTVYVSLWKYFNSGIGSMLAGPKRLLEGMYHVRRMFGGNLATGWQAALVARHYMKGFPERLSSAIAVSEAFYKAIADHPRVAIERIPNGTNLTRLTLRGIDPALVARRLSEQGLRLPAAGPGGVFVLGVNETWSRISAPDLVRTFEQALSD